MISGLLISYMMKLAQQRHGIHVEPAGKASAWHDAVTKCDVTNTITLWYNVPGDRSTHNIIFTQEGKG